MLCKQYRCAHSSTLRGRFQSFGIYQPPLPRRKRQLNSADIPTPSLRWNQCGKLLNSGDISPYSHTLFDDFISGVIYDVGESILSEDLPILVKRAIKGMVILRISRLGKFRCMKIIYK